MSAPPGLGHHPHPGGARRPPPRPWPHPTQRSGPPAAPLSTPPRAIGWCPAGPTDQATLKRVLTATVRGAGTAPASVLSTGSLAPRKAELGRPRPILIPRGGPRPWRSYQLNAGNRCADRPFRRSRSTVAAKVIRSIGALVCVPIAHSDGCRGDLSFPRPESRILTAYSA